jgi:hypothetical protein
MFLSISFYIFRLEAIDMNDGDISCINEGVTSHVDDVLDIEVVVAVSGPTDDDDDALAHADDCVPNNATAICENYGADISSGYV